MGRYTSRPKLKNNSTLYHEVLEKRGVQHIIQYDTAKFKSLNRLNLSVQTHIWQRQDRLAKLADTYYGDPTKWWVIGFYNQKPTDSHFMVGEAVFIPFPLDDILKEVNG
jgi:nucleoid-associated protein YgaU